LGQLGLNDGLNRCVPNQIGTDSDWSKITAGGYYTLGLKTNATLWAWGDNEYSKLGLADNITRYTPSQVGSQSDWFSIAAGPNHVLGLKTSGVLWAWGLNSIGQLGFGDLFNRSIPCQLGTPSPPYPVTIIVVSPTQIDLSWNNLSNETGFYIERSTDNVNYALLVTLDANTISYSDITVFPGNVYYYRVRGYNSFGNGPYYNSVTPVLSPPSVLTLTVVSSSQINLSWRDNSPDEAEFQIERKISGTAYSQLATVDSNITTYSDMTVSIGNVYYYRVRVVNAFVNSNYSNEATPVLSAPSLLTLNVISSTQINLSWKDNSPDEAGFQIERSALTNTNYALLVTVGPASGGITSFSDTTVISGTIYYYRIRAFNVFTNSVYSNEVTPRLPYVPVLAFPDVISSSRIDLSWVYNISETQDAGFIIERKTPGTSYSQLVTVGQDITTYSDITSVSFAPNTAYYYRVEAYNAFTVSAYSNEVPVAISGDWSKVVAGPDHTLSIKTNGTLWAWGKNNYGQLGLGDTTYRIIPTQVGFETDWLKIDSQWRTTFGIRTNYVGGTLWSWGYNSSGLLLGRSGNEIIPGQVGTNSDWSEVSAGDYHCLVLKTNGTCWSWGFNSSGQLGLGNTNNRDTPCQVGVESDWSIIKGFSLYSMALKTNMTLYIWGSGYSSTPAQIGNDSDWNILSKGMAIKTNPAGGGTLWSISATPTQYGTDSDWASFARGEYHYLAGKSNGTLWSWGRNQTGQLGLGDYNYRAAPVQIGINSDWFTIQGFSVTVNKSADDPTYQRYGHSLAIKTNGTLWSWGYNNYGQLGLGYISNKNIPQPVYSVPSAPAPLTITIIACVQINLTWNDISNNELYFEIERGSQPNNYSLLSTLNPNVISYQDNVTVGNIYYYRIRAYNGIGYSTYSNSVNATAGIPAPSLLAITSISPTQINLSWMDNSIDELGFKIERKSASGGGFSLLASVNQDIITYSDTAVTSGNTYLYRIKAWNALTESAYSNIVSSVPKYWTEVSCGSDSTLAISTNGTFWSWGANSDGQLGLGNTLNRNLPCQIGVETDWLVISGGGGNFDGGKFHSAGLKTNGSIWSWGNNTYGQLGLGHTNSRKTPTQVIIGTDYDWSTIVASGYQTYARKTNGTLWLWGHNEAGQLGLGDYALRTSPTPINAETNWVSISKGYWHCLALKTNPLGGTLWSWGFYEYGELGREGDNNTPGQVGADSDWIFTAAGELHSIAIKSNRTLWSWGFNDDGELGLGFQYGDTGLPAPVGADSDWSSVACGATHNIALKTNRTIWSWGGNQYGYDPGYYFGQLGLGDIYIALAPTQIGTYAGWVKNAVGYNHSIAIKSNGTIWAWGLNNSGQLGLGDNNNRNTLTMVGE
jgi:alpha-tubulin suppressor-like RCC1 family protein